MADGPPQFPGFTALPALKRPYFDASVFLAHLKQEATACRNTTRFDITTRLFADAEAGKFQIYTSFITITEVRRLQITRGVFKQPLDASELATINGLFRKYLENAWIVPIEVGRLVAEKAQELGAQYDISTQDAIHLASAIIAGCDALLIWDKAFLSKFPIRDATNAVRIVENIILTEPYWQGLKP